MIPPIPDFVYPRGARGIFGGTFAAPMAAAMGESGTAGLPAPTWHLSGGILTSEVVAAYQPLGAPSQAASYANVNSPGTYDAFPEIEPAWSTAGGWAFNGSTHRLATSIIPPANQTWSMFIEFAGVVGTGGALAGATSGTKYFLLQPNRSDGKVGYFNQDLLLVAPALTSGDIAIAGNKAYRNGVAETGTMGTGTTSLPYLYIGTLHSDTGFVIYINASIKRMAIYNVVLSAAQVAALHASTYSSWGSLTNHRLASMPLAKSQLGLESCNGKIYAVGGALTDGSPKKLYEYTPSTNAWATKTDLPFAQPEHQSAIWRTVNGKIYLIGGLDSSAPATLYGDVWEYNPSNDTWTQKTSMPTPREDFGSAVYNGKVYCFGGITVVGTPSTASNVMEVYDPATDTWDETKADMPAAKVLGDFGCFCNGKIYAISAQNTMVGYPTLAPVTTVYEYDPVGDSWATKAAIPAGTDYKECGVIGNKIYVVGGAAAPTYGTSSVYAIRVYDTTNNTWSQAIDAPYRASGAGLVEFNDKIYMCGGYDGVSYRSDLYLLALP
jgi:N-acetylneuraminic acid mutarotase